MKWEPEVTQELLEWLADHTAGYCGADIKCLCTEAALAALRDKYPQIYSSDVKLKISVDSIRISKRHFQKAMEVDNVFCASVHTIKLSKTTKRL